MAGAPNLAEKDARKLTRAIVTEIRKMGVNVTQFGVYLFEEGFTFMATINGRSVQCLTGQGNFTYQAVAAEIVNAALHGGDEALLAPVEGHA